MEKGSTELPDIAGMMDEIGALEVAVASGGTSAEALLRQASQLLEKLRSAPGRFLTEDPPAPGSADSPYAALRWNDGAGGLLVLCWKEAGFRLQGEYRLDVLEKVDLQGGDRAVGMALAEDGEVAYDTASEDFSLPTVAEQARARTREGRVESARKQLREAMCAMGGWDCPACACFNEEGSVICERCQAPAPPEVVRSQSALATARASGKGSARGGDAAEGIRTMLTRLSSGAHAVTAAVATAASALPKRPQRFCACGTKLAEGARFCTACGAPVPILCPSCAAEWPPGTKFCANCGTRLDPSGVERP